LSCNNYSYGRIIIILAPSQLEGYTPVVQPLYFQSVSLFSATGTSAAVSPLTTNVLNYFRPFSKKQYFKGHFWTLVILKLFSSKIGS
jgi:hypothetical protein